MTQDFLLGQLRLAMVALLAYAGGRGWLTPTDAGLATALMTSLGPILAPWIWSVYVNINKKIVPHDAIVKVLIACFLVSAFLVPRAEAGDIAPPALTAINKALAPLPPPCSVTGCSGFFLGAEFSGSGTGVNVLNLGALSANGNYMGGNAGYQFFNGTYWLSAEAEVTYDVAPPAGIVSPGFSNKIFAFEGVEIGGNLSTLFNIAPINLPGPLAGAVPTIKIGACQNGSHLSGYCAGAAAHFFIPNSKFTVDVSYLNAQYGTTSVAPGQTANVENRGTFGFDYHF